MRTDPMVTVTSRRVPCLARASVYTPASRATTKTATETAASMFAFNLLSAYVNGARSGSWVRVGRARCENAA